MKKLLFITLITLPSLIGCKHTHKLFLVEKLEPTCTHIGLESHYECEGCDLIFNLDKEEISLENIKIDKLPHEVSDWIVDRAPTKYRTGRKIKECINCHKIFEEEKLPRVQVMDSEWITDSLYNLELRNGVVECTNYDFVVNIKKEKGKDFKILNLTDIHIKDNVSKESNDVIITDYTISKLVHETNPDLITVNGDQGNGTILTIQSVGNLIDKHNIPWAPIFGNHDNMCYELKLQEQVLEYSKFDNCIIKMGPKNIGQSKFHKPLCGTYIINIVDVSNNNIEVLRSLFMINTGEVEWYSGNDDERISSNNWARNTPEQIAFFNWGIESANQYSTCGVKSTIFQHIPMTAYAHALREALNTSFSVYEYEQLINYSKTISLADSYQPDIWNDGYKDSFGVAREAVGCPCYEDDVFEQFTAKGSLDSVIVGHDHINNFCIKYKGVYLAYGLKTGRGSYSNSDLNGGTKITIDDTNQVNISHVYIKKKI